MPGRSRSAGMAQGHATGAAAAGAPDLRQERTLPPETALLAARAGAVRWPRGARQFAARFKLGAEAGRGCFGRVLRGFDNEQGTHVAIKLVGGEEGAPPATTSAVRSFLHECALHAEVSSCRNVTDFFGVWEFEPGCFAAATAFCGGGELFHKIQSIGAFSEDCAAGITRQLLRALQHLHARGIVHRDLKPENILFSEPPGRAGAGGRADGLDGEVRLIDFGFANKFGCGRGGMASPTAAEGGPAAATPPLDPGDAKGHARAFRTRLGSPNYVAPEILSSREGYGVSVDVWSLGVILYIMLCGYFPFYHDSERELYRQIRRGEFDMPAEDWKGISKEAKDLVRQMLTQDPGRRLTAAECLRHRWLAPGEASRQPLPVASRERLATFIESEKKRPKLKKAMDAVLKGMRGGSSGDKGGGGRGENAEGGTPARTKQRGAAPPAAAAAELTPSPGGRAQCTGSCNLM